MCWSSRRLIILQNQLCSFWGLSHRRSPGPNGAKNSPKSYSIIFNFNRHPEGSSAVGLLMLYGAAKMEKSRKVAIEVFFFSLFGSSFLLVSGSGRLMLLSESRTVQAAGWASPLSLNSSFSRIVAQQRTAMASLPSRHFSLQIENEILLIF